MSKEISGSEIIQLFLGSKEEGYTFNQNTLFNGIREQFPDYPLTRGQISGCIARMQKSENISIHYNGSRPSIYILIDKDFSTKYRERGKGKMPGVENKNVIVRKPVVDNSKKNTILLEYDVVELLKEIPTEYILEELKSRIP